MMANTYANETPSGKRSPALRPDIFGDEVKFNSLTGESTK